MCWFWILGLVLVVFGLLGFLVVFLGRGVFSLAGFFWILVLLGFIGFLCFWLFPVAWG